MSVKHFTDWLEYKDGGLYWTKSPCSWIKVGDRAGTVRSGGYRQVGVRGKLIREHKLIWLMHGNDIPDGFELDHINNVRDDNRIENLRLATRGENSHNHSLQRRNRFGIKGMGIRVRGNCKEYIGCIRHNGKVYQKSSVDKEVVVDWLTTTREKLHQDFANHG